MNPFAIVGSIFDTLWKTRKLEQFFKLCFSIGASCALTFCAACGKDLVAGGSWHHAIGTGMIWIAIAGSAGFTISPMTRGMFLTLPKGSWGNGSEVETLQKDK